MFAFTNRGYSSSKVFATCLPVFPVSSTQRGLSAELPQIIVAFAVFGRGCKQISPQQHTLCPLCFLRRSSRRSFFWFERFAAQKAVANLPFCAPYCAFA